MIKDAPAATALGRMAALAREARVDGWLAYDFRGLNPLASSVLGLSGFLSRRWFVYVPADGMPTLVHHRIEAGTWAGLLPGEVARRLAYSSHEELDAALAETLRGARRVAMEYSPRGAVPYVGRVDAGTVERVRDTGVEVVSSADLLQAFLAWSDDDRRAHDRAVGAVVRAKDDGFLFLHDRLRDGPPPTELEAQAVIERTLRREGLGFDHPPIVGFGPHSGDPHYAPSPATDRPLEPGTAVLVDLWGAEPGRPHADITWVGHAGAPPPRYREVWSAVRDARDAALAALAERFRPGAAVEGWEIDRVARDLIASRGLGEAFTHRLGHSLGGDLHGPGANLDDLETHDTRQLVPGLAVTVEPGVYLPEFGVRSEVNVFLDPSGPVVTTPTQQGPYVLGGDVLAEALA